MTVDHLDMALLYEPAEKGVTSQYAYYKSIQRKPTAFRSKLFNEIIGDLDKLFSKYYTNPSDLFSFIPARLFGTCNAGIKFKLS